MDTFLLKSLNAIDYNTTLNDYNISIYQEDYNSEYLISIQLNNENKIPLISNGRNSYDKIIYCTGWKFNNNLYDFDLTLTNNKKYPLINSKYESINNKNLYFIGSLMHSLDFKKSSGGFIHGFRYLIKSFINLNYQIGFDNILFKFENNDDCINLVDFIINRINTSSDLYQMFEYLSDILYYDLNEKKIEYYLNIPINCHVPKQKSNTLFFQITLEYGDKITNILEIGSKKSNIGSESKSVLIHPVLRIFNSYPLQLIDVIHFDEDLFAEYTDINKYHDKLYRALKSYIIYSL
jgi:hypothetical protein